MRNFLRFFSFLLFLLVISSCTEPMLPHSVLELPPSEGNSRNSEGDFILLNDGSILFAYSKFLKGSGDDHDPSVIALRQSRDKGETWSPEDRIIAENQDEPNGNVMSVSFLRLSAERIAIFYLKKIHDGSEQVFTRVMMKVSDDEGKTWSKEQDCTQAMPLEYRVVNNSRVIRLSSGRILIPAASHAYHGPGSYDMDSDARLYCLYSDDNGESWQQGEGFYIEEDGKRVITQEPGVIQMKDGNVLMYIRTNTGYQWYATSKDGGKTWQDKRHASFTGPLSPAKIVRLDDGRLLNLWNDHEGREDLLKKGARTPLTLALSTDEGKTWPKKLNIEDGYDPENIRRFHYCYTATLELKDRLLLAYCAHDNLQHLRILSFPKTSLPK